MTSPIERDFAASLRDLLMDEITQRGWDEERVAQETGLLPEGVRTLFARPRWDLDSAVLIARGLRIRIVPHLEEQEQDTVRA